MYMMRFSIVIPLYNKEKSVLRAVKSVLNQNYEKFELIIVNDGSTDNSLEVVKKIKDDRISIINKSNGGVSSARNFGIKAANTDYICFLDADDYWKPNHLKLILELIYKYPDGSIYSTLIEEKSNRGIYFIQNSLPEEFEGYLDNYFAYAHKGTIFHSSSVCVKKEALLEFDGFDIKLKHGEDLDVWFKLMVKRRGVVKKAATVVYDLFGENRAMSSKCNYENHLLSTIDDLRDENVKYINGFIDYFILRNSVPYYFSIDKNKVYPILIKVIAKKEIKLIWKYVYSEKLYKINILLYRLYKYIRMKF